MITMASSMITPESMDSFIRKYCFHRWLHQNGKTVNNSGMLWKLQKNKDSRLAREFVVALPVELDKDSNISLLKDFIQKNFVRYGHVR